MLYWTSRELKPEQTAAKKVWLPWRLFTYRMFPKKYRCLINNRTKVFRRIFWIFSDLDKAYPNLDFEIKMVEIRWKLSEIWYIKIQH